MTDSAYGNKGFLDPNQIHDHLIILSRVRSNRTFYRAIDPQKNKSNKIGHPQWYGEKFKLNNQTTWHSEDEIFETTITNKKGEVISVTIKAWFEMLMKGDKINKMHCCPFNLLQITLTDEKGNRIKKPMWLIVIGKRRKELSLSDCYQSYTQRFDLEHMFRFSKNKLLLNKYYTPEVKHEENWFQLVLLSYVNLWAARNLAINIPRQAGEICTEKIAIKNNS